PMNQFLKTILLVSALLSVLLLAGCQQDEAIQGEIMLWHSWPEDDSAVLAQIVTNYETINPGATVLVQRLEPNQIVDRYTSSVANGLGPDLIILPSTAVMSLAEQGAIDPIDDETTAVTQDRYFRAALDSMRYDDALYGLPLALEPMVMFYNPQTVAEPATTLDMLLAQAEAGNEVALNTSFEGLFWGIQAFGGQVLREDGMVNINSGGVANWLRWLQRAQSTPGMILSRDNDALTDLFVEGTADYFAAPITRYDALVAQMGEENVAVMPLPAGPSGSSGPLLHVESLMFNPHSSPNQRALALNLAQFLTNTEQSRGLMRQTGRAPANRNVQVLATAYPVVTAVISQARTAVPTRYKRTLAELYPLGDRVLAEMLEGSLDPNQALAQLSEGAGENAAITAVPESTSQACTQSGKLVISHGWRGSAEEWLQAQARRYMAECPGTLISLNRINTSALLGLYQAQVAAETAPELLLGPDQWLMPLVDAGQVAPMPAPQNDPD
ncbi:MAG: extracellular solute-binding protein, partial [Anaerolineales bacterium]|nr:extracellular solute-binding protein [Anaerolineales bacterium]